jgi:hypothetical protein
VIHVVVLASLAACVPGRGWSRANTALEATFLAELAVDGAQTEAWILPGCTETNPIVGRCGERVPVPLYLAGAAVLHVAVAWLLPGRARDAWQAITIGVEGHVVLQNALVHARRADE